MICVLNLLLELLEYPTVTLLLSKFKFCNKALEKHTPRLFIKPKGVTVCLAAGATMGKDPWDIKLRAPVGVVATCAIMCTEWQEPLVYAVNIVVRVLGILKVVL